VLLRLRHLGRLTRDVVGYASVNRVWWLVPLGAVLLLVGLAVTATNVAVPVAVYTLF
jgi:hypothetical protein